MEHKNILALMAASVLSFIAPIQDLIIYTLLFFLFEYITDTMCHIKRRKNKKYNKLYINIVKSHFYSSILSTIIVILSYVLSKNIISVDGVSLERLTASYLCIHSFLKICTNSAYICSKRTFILIKKKVGSLVNKI